MRDAQFAFHGALAGTGLAGQNAVGQLHCRFVGQVRGQRLLAFDAAFLRVQMTAVQLDQALPGQLAHPGIEGQRPLPQIVVETASGVEQRFLYHVGRIDTRGQAAIDVDGDHVLQALAVPNQHGLTRLFVAAFGASQQFVGVRSVFRHERNLSVEAKHSREEIEYGLGRENSSPYGFRKRMV